jgi:hypothetical protein
MRPQWTRLSVIGRNGSLTSAPKCFGLALSARMPVEIGGVGSDIDLIALLRESDEPFHTRASAFDTTVLPVPADLLVYTLQEWNALIDQPGFAQSADRDAIWVGTRHDTGS